MDNSKSNPDQLSNDSEKTKIMNNSQSAQQNQSNEDRTIVDQNTTTSTASQADKTQVESTDSSKKSDQSPGASPNNNTSASDKSNDVNPSGATANSKLLNKTQPQKGGVSTAAFVAGVAGAAVAGTALGTVYSEDIESAVSSLTEDSATETPGVSDAQTPPSPTAEAEAISTAAHIDQPDSTDSSSMPMETISISGADESGNVYSVSFIDFEGDGKIDFSEADVTLVDGTNISYSGFGNPLEEIFQNTNELATPDDYMQFLPTGGSEVPFDPISFNPETNPISLDENQTFDYTIQPGDTLSEIAASNNTSIENIVDLNPDIHNPDLIYAGNDLTIPANDNISNPYQTSDPVEGIIEPVGDGLVVENYELDTQTEAGVGYEQIDWISYDDTPVNLDNSDFYNEFEQTDFDNYSSTTSYVEDSFFESGNQDAISSFV